MGSGFARKYIGKRGRFESRIQKTGDRSQESGDGNQETGVRRKPVRSKQEALNTATTLGRKDSMTLTLFEPYKPDKRNEREKRF